MEPKRATVLRGRVEKAAEEGEARPALAELTGERAEVVKNEVVTGVVGTPEGLLSNLINQVRGQVTRVRLTLSRSR